MFYYALILIFLIYVKYHIGSSAILLHNYQFSDTPEVKDTNSSMSLLFVNSTFSVSFAFQISYYQFLLQTSNFLRFLPMYSKNNNVDTSVIRNLCGITTFVDTTFSGNTMAVSFYCIFLNLKIFHI